MVVDNPAQVFRSGSNLKKKKLTEQQGLYNNNNVRRYRRTDTFCTQWVTYYSSDTRVEISRMKNKENEKDTLHSAL